MKSTPRFPAQSIMFRERKSPLRQTRALNSLSIDTIEALKLLTIDPKYPPTIVGSFKYIVHEYPADIDLFEYYKADATTLDEAAKEIAAKIQDMAKRLSASKNVYLGDFKAGYDDRFLIDIGKMSGAYKLSGYKPFLIRERIIELGHQGLLEPREVDMWLLKVIDGPSLVEWMDLDELIRSKYILRWSLSELIAGHKKLLKGRDITLAETLTQNSIVKIDIWVYLGRYVEMTNFYKLCYVNDKGKEIDITASQGVYETSLIKDLKYYNNPSVNKYMKLAKRIWLYAVLKKNSDLMARIYPLFGSGAAKMYQIIGEIETILNILKKVSKPNMKMIKDNIEDWKTRLGTVMSDILPIDIAHKIYDRIDQVYYERNKELISMGLGEVHDKLNFHINRYVKLYFKKNAINVEEIM